MFAVVAHSSGRIDVEDLQALIARGLLGWRAGQAPRYCVLGVRAWQVDAWALRRELVKQRGEPGAVPQERNYAGAPAFADELRRGTPACGALADSPRASGLRI